MMTLAPYPLPLPALKRGSLGPLRGLCADAEPCPGRLLAMVCDAARRFLVAAEAAMAADRTGCAASNIRRAQSILLEMLAAVQHGAVPNAPDLAEALARLCQDLLDRLFEAVTDGDIARVREARRLLTGLRNAWTCTAPA